MINAYYKGIVLKIDETFYMWKLGCGIYLSLHSVNIFMEVPRSNNAKIEAALMIVQTRDIWKTSEAEAEQLWTHAANITGDQTHTHTVTVMYSKRRNISALVLNVFYIER